MGLETGLVLAGWSWALGWTRYRTRKVAQKKTSVWCVANTACLSRCATMMNCSDTINNVNGSTPESMSWNVHMNVLKICRQIIGVPTR